MVPVAARCRPRGDWANILPSSNNRVTIVQSNDSATHLDKQNNSATHLDKGIAEDYCYRVEMSNIF